MVGWAVVVDDIDEVVDVVVEDPVVTFVDVAVVVVAVVAVVVVVVVERTVRVVMVVAAVVVIVVLGLTPTVDGGVDESTSETETVTEMAGIRSS